MAPESLSCNSDQSMTCLCGKLIKSLKPTSVVSCSFLVVHNRLSLSQTRVVKLNRNLLIRLPPVLVNLGDARPLEVGTACISFTTVDQCRGGPGPKYSFNKHC